MLSSLVDFYYYYYYYFLVGLYISFLWLQLLVYELQGFTAVVVSVETASGTASPGNQHWNLHKSLKITKK